VIAGRRGRGPTRRAWPRAPTRGGCGDAGGLAVDRGEEVDEGAAADAQHRRERDQMRRRPGRRGTWSRSRPRRCGRGWRARPRRRSGGRAGRRRGEAGEQGEAAQPQAAAGLPSRTQASTGRSGRPPRGRPWRRGTARAGRRRPGGRRPRGRRGCARGRGRGGWGRWSAGPDQAVVHGEGGGAEDPEQEQAGLVVGVDEAGEQGRGEGRVDVAGLIEAVDLADAEAGVDQAEEGDAAAEAGDERRADAPRQLGGGDVEGGQAEQAGGLEGAVPGDR
jgi:hypothetical protein